MHYRLSFKEKQKAEPLLRFKKYEQKEGLSLVLPFLILNPKTLTGNPISVF